MAAEDTAFDAMAAEYDRDFTHGAIGRLMRNAVWARCSARFSAGMRVLDMNCGTGEDALWLARHGMQVFATDVSRSMLQVARAKLACVPAATAVRFDVLTWERLHTLDEPPFDAVLSNFGGLNCVEDLRGTAVALASRLKPGAVAILCIMGPLVPWEWAWFLCRGRAAKAFRRLRKEGATWRSLRIRYPSVARLTEAFAPEFALLRAAGIGALLPPPYTAHFTARFPRVLYVLNRVERRFESAWPMPRLADHYLVELRRA